MAKGDVVFAFGGTFLVGVLVASIGNLWWMLIAASAIFLFAIRKWNLKICASIILFLTLGFFYFFLFENFTEPNLVSGEKIEAMVLDEPSVYDKYQKLTLESQGKEFETITSPEKIFRYGDIVGVTPQKIENKVLIFPEIEFIKSEPGKIKGNLIKFRHFVIEKYNRHLSHKSASLMQGIMLGYKSNFSKEFKDNLSKSGTAHIVALSGYNIAILILAISYFFVPLVGRKTTFGIMTVLIVLFTLMVGGEASIVRAAIMGFLIILAKETGRLYSLRNAIIFAAFLMVLFDPRILAFDLGFQLSFLSLFGIVYVSPLIKLGVSKLKSIPLGVKDNISNTLAAQLMVSPLILNTFGQISLLGIVANVLILSFVPLAMLLGFILFVLSIFSAGLAEILSWFLEFLLQYMIGVINLFGNLNIGFSGELGPFYTIGYYLVIIWLMYNFRKHERA